MGGSVRLQAGRTCTNAARRAAAAQQCSGRGHAHESAGLRRHSPLAKSYLPATELAYQRPPCFESTLGESAARSHCFEPASGSSGAQGALTRSMGKHSRSPSPSSSSGEPGGDGRAARRSAALPPASPSAFCQVQNALRLLSLCPWHPPGSERRQRKDKKHKKEKHKSKDKHKKHKKHRRSASPDARLAAAKAFLQDVGCAWGAGSCCLRACMHACMQ